MSKKKTPSKAKPKSRPRSGSAALAVPKDAAEVRLSEHPRAQHQIRRAKGWAGLAGCGLAAYASWHAGLPFFDVATRALLGGLAAYLLVWFCAVQVWRHLAVAEVRAAEKVWSERRAEAERVARERAAAAMAGSPHG